MKSTIKILSTLALSAVVLFSCSSDDDNTTTIQTTVTKSEVISNYGTIVYQSYLDSYNGALDLQTAINTFVATPTDANFTAAKTAWVAAREPYGQTEAYRECNGPVDVDGTTWGLGTEGQMNAWPIDESYIDYVESSTAAYAGSYTSIISDASVTIDVATIAGLNEMEHNGFSSALIKGIVTSHEKIGK